MRNRLAVNGIRWGSGGPLVLSMASLRHASTNGGKVPPVRPRGSRKVVLKQTAPVPSGDEPQDLQSAPSQSFEIDYKERFSTRDYGPVRATGLWKVDEVNNPELKTVDFRRIDEIESDIAEDLAGRGDALVPYADEESWKHKLMFQYKFKKTPKHLTWKELGQEIECLDCTIEPDAHRPEELFTIKFFFVDRRKGTRDVVWSARNDVAASEGLTDLMAAVGSCLGRADVYRTIRFDDGLGITRDLCFRKKSRYTSDIQISFRPVAKYNLFDRKEEENAWETEMAKDGMSTWGFHPQLMDPEYQEMDDPEETYTISLSTHAFAFIFLRSIERLLSRPMKDFYRPSQLMRTVKVASEDEIGLTHALKGWLGVDAQVYPHFTPIEAVQENWLGRDAPFTMIAMVNKLREMAYLKRRNPEFQSWLGVRKRDTSLAIRNISVKMLGAGASVLFVPVGHNATVNRLLPKSQQRRLESKFSVNAMLGMPDESRNLGDFKKITGHHRISVSGADEHRQKTSVDVSQPTSTGPRTGEETEPK